MHKISERCSNKRIPYLTAYTTLSVDLFFCPRVSHEKQIPNDVLIHNMEYLIALAVQRYSAVSCERSNQYYKRYSIYCFQTM